jgi:formate-dependent nitrite reductase membrane component NrfD
MTPTNARQVGTSFKLGYRFQSYWGSSIANAFFTAEVGAGTFLMALIYDDLVSMVAGLLLAGILKPYFHIAHMGVPRKSWRAILRLDRSWISRGALAIGMLVVFGGLTVIDRGFDLAAKLGLPPLFGSAATILAIAAAVVVICYQGLTMAASQAFTLWASPLLPAASAGYALTAGSLTVLTISWDRLALPRRAGLVGLSEVLLLLDLFIVAGILLQARRKSRGGAFSVALMLTGELAPLFRIPVLLVGLAAPLAIMILWGSQRPLVALAWLAMLVGFYAFRLVMLRAAVFEPISHDWAGAIGLPGAR